LVLQIEGEMIPNRVVSRAVLSKALLLASLGVAVPRPMLLPLRMTSPLYGIEAST